MDEQDLSFRSALIQAVNDSALDVVDELITMQNFDVNDVLDGSKAGSYDWCALGAALEIKNEKMAKFLVKEMKADVNLINNRSGNNLLTQAILLSDFWTVKFLLQDLKANTNLSPLHNAIWADFQSSRSEWNMTKHFLSFGADPSVKFNWIQDGGVIYFHKGNIFRDAFQFFFNLQEVNQGKLKSYCFEELFQLMREEALIIELLKMIDSGDKDCLKYLTKINPKKKFVRSPLVHATSHGRQDLVHLMVSFLDFNVDECEALTGINPLVMAVSTRNMDMVKYLVLEMGANIHSQCKLPLEIPVLGTALTLAVANEDFSMVKLLIEDLGANVKDHIILGGHVSSHVHVALERMSRSKMETIFNMLLSHGGDINFKGWIEIKSTWRYISPIKLALAYQARQPEDDLFWTNIAHSLTEIYLEKQHEALEKMSFVDSVADLKEEALVHEWNQKRLKQKLECMSRKCNSISIIESQLQTNPECSLKNYEKKLKTAKTLSDQLTSFQPDPHYQIEDEFKKLQSRLVKDAAKDTDAPYSETDSEEQKFEEINDEVELHPKQTKPDLIKKEPVGILSESVGTVEVQPELVNPVNEGPKPVDLISDDLKPVNFNPELVNSIDFLPDIVETKTGEEDEEVLFEQRAKCYCFNAEAKEWMVKGVGQLKILNHINGGYRVLHRHEFINTVAANHRITTDINVIPHEQSKAAVCYHALDFADEVLKPEFLSFRFKLEQSAQLFQTIFKQCQQEIKAAEVQQKFKPEQLLSKYLSHRTTREDFQAAKTSNEITDDLERNMSCDLENMTIQQNSDLEANKKLIKVGKDLKKLEQEIKTNPEFMTTEDIEKLSYQHQNRLIEAHTQKKLIDSLSVVGEVDQLKENIKRIWSLIINPEPETRKILETKSKCTEDSASKTVGNPDSKVEAIITDAIADEPSITVHNDCATFLSESADIKVQADSAPKINCYDNNDIDLNCLSDFGSDESDSEPKHDFEENSYVQIGEDEEYDMLKDCKLTVTKDKKTR